MKKSDSNSSPRIKSLLSGIELALKNSGLTEPIKEQPVDTSRHKLYMKLKKQIKDLSG